MVSLLVFSSPSKHGAHLQKLMLRRKQLLCLSVLRIRRINAKTNYSALEEEVS
jgi:hypothetical protein